MKYHYTKTKYNINVQYKDINELIIPIHNRDLWIIYSIDNKYLALDNCVFCSNELIISHEILKHKYDFFTF